MRHWRQRLGFLFIDALLAAALIALIYWVTGWDSPKTPAWLKGMRYFAIGVGLFSVIEGLFRHMPRRGPPDRARAPRRVPFKHFVILCALSYGIALVPMMFATAPVEPRWIHWMLVFVTALILAPFVYYVFARVYQQQRLRRMRKRGLCPKCAYPIGTSDVCTECGNPVKPKAAPA